MRGKNNIVSEQYALLGDCRVLDLTQGGCMLCGKLLEDIGADVIQIELPGGSRNHLDGAHLCLVSLAQRPEGKRSREFPDCDISIQQGR